MQGPMDYMNEMGTIMAGQEPYETYDFFSTEDFAESFKKDTVVGNPTKPSLFNKITSVPTGVYGAGKMVWNMLSENHFIKGVKNNPDKYMGNPKYVNDAEKWFEKQGQEQFGAIFEENPESAIKVAQANKAIYDYLNSTIDGQKKIQEMGLNKNSIDTQLEKANAFETAANLKAESYSAYQGDYSGSAEGVAAKKQVYANMSDNELNNTMAAGADQYSGMAIGGQGVYVDISDGIAPGTKFKSGTIFVKWKKEEREERAKEEKKEEVVKTTKQDNQKDSGSSNQQGSGGGSGPVGMVGSPTKPKPRTGPDLTKRQLGGPIGNPMGQQQQVPVQDAGNLELVQEQGKDMSGVADDVPRELDEGDFVINAPAVEMAGRGDIERMVTKAITELQRKGIKLDFGQAAEDADSIVQALVSNKEMIIPKVIAEQIGYDRLEKINNRGKQRVEEIEQQQQQQQQGFIQGNPQAVQMGGQIALDENKNQPIAVPRESFAGQSSVGRKLLSPLSPESQNDEKELQEKSQSFEGFLKPLKMNKGGKFFTDEEFNRLIMRESSGIQSAEGDLDTGDKAVGLTQVRGLALEDVNNELGTNYTKDDLLNNADLSKLVGKTYLNQQLKRFGDKRLALAAYNLGPTAVKNITENSMLNYHKLPSDVKDYVSTILNKIVPEIKPKPTRQGMMAVN